MNPGPLLLDTCVVLWLFEDSSELPIAIRTLLSEPDQEAYVSEVSALEIVIKHQTGRLKSERLPSQWLPTLAARHLVTWLPLTLESIFAMELLPPLHRDPFDRLLAAQTATHRLTLVTPDRQLRRYPIKTFWRA